MSARRQTDTNEVLSGKIAGSRNAADANVPVHTDVVKYQGFDRGVDQYLLTWRVLEVPGKHSIIVEHMSTWQIARSRKRNECGVKPLRSTPDVMDGLRPRFSFFDACRGTYLAPVLSESGPDVTGAKGVPDVG